MNIEITSLLERDQFALSHSAHEGGQNAGQNTWRASLEAAEETPLLDTPDKLQAMRDFALDSGGWDEAEAAEWTEQEVNALFLQWIAGDCRQCPAKDGGRADSLDEIEWRKTRRAQEQGQCPSNLYKQGRKIYFSLDS